MSRSIRLAIVTVAVMSAASEARAQYGYPYGYGGYGWGGWGSSPAGSLARGLGVFNMGRGVYNKQTAEAASINTNTVMRWNNYLFQSSRESAQRYAARMNAKVQQTTKLQGEIEDRLRNHPEERDITDGDALNVVLDVLLNPTTADRSIGQIRTPLKNEVIRDIPFEYASEGMTVCLDKMTMDGQWPVSLRVESLRPERDALRKAVTAALEEDKNGNLEPNTIQAVQTAVDNLRLKFEKEVPKDRPDYVTSENTIKAMNGLTRMLYSPNMNKVIAELEDYQGTTVGDLIGFMHAFNLRFGPTNSARQRYIYLKIYPMLREQADGGSLGSTANEAARGGIGSRERGHEGCGVQANDQHRREGGWRCDRRPEVSGRRFLQGHEVLILALAAETTTTHQSQRGLRFAPAALRWNEVASRSTIETYLTWQRRLLGIAPNRVQKTNLDLSLHERYRAAKVTSGMSQSEGNR